MIAAIEKSVNTIDSIMPTLTQLHNLEEQRASIEEREKIINSLFIENEKNNNSMQKEYEELEAMIALENTMMPTAPSHDPAMGNAAGSQPQIDSEQRRGEAAGVTEVRRTGKTEKVALEC